ncbi:MAG: aldo/keto reductase [Cephaloticoccus sp.]|nr:aldo/keto reductase [Cephaloticoccus sp.]MCF7759239.1 aldo/keto reductase [Cephaloticoccus sp.]
MSGFPSSSRPTRRVDFGLAPALVAQGLGDSRLALGLAGLGGAWGPVDQDESLATIQRALELGLNVFDTAPAYGTAEALLGRALGQWRGPRPIISTKVGRLAGRDSHEENYDHTPAGMRASLERSLDALGVAKVDLLFLHEPQMVSPAERPRVVDTLRALQADGLVLRLGIGGGFGSELDGFIESGAFDVMMLFRRVDPVMLDGVGTDVPRLRRTGMTIYGASPLHMGLLGSRHEQFVRERPDWVWGPQIDRAQQLQVLARRHGLPLAALAHRFTFGVGELDRVVIGASNRGELRAALADFEAGPLPPGLFDAVCQINEPRS